jgi:hypothetical protein
VTRNRIMPSKRVRVTLRRMLVSFSHSWIACALRAGELIPDEGDASICGLSVRHSLEAARQLVGYCPQFDALPGQMTGREVLVMYALLRGVSGHRSAVQW